MNEDDVYAPKEGPMVNAPNKFSCTLGALNENGSDSVRIERVRVHELIAALRWALRSIDILNELLRGLFGRSPSDGDGGADYRTARARAERVLSGCTEARDGPD